MMNWHWVLVGWAFGLANGYMWALIVAELRKRRRDRVETAAFEKYFENREKNRFDL